MPSSELRQHGGQQARVRDNKRRAGAAAAAAGNITEAPGNIVARRFLKDVTNKLTCLLMYCFRKRSASDSF